MLSSTTPVKGGGDITQNPDYQAFLLDEFDSNAYANHLLSSPEADAGAALGKLNGGIDEVNRQLRYEVRVWILTCSYGRIKA